MEGYSKQTLLHKDDAGEIWLCQGAACEQKAIQHIFYHESETIKIYQALQKIRQKQLPQILEVEPLDSGFAVLEEYIEGVSVGELICGGRSFTEKEICALALQMCAALKALHQNGIIHRDVKPGNILMKPTGEAVLIDFDASRFYTPYQEKDTVVLGTEGYAAPEQYGFFQTDFRADIYALGVTLRELPARNGIRCLQKILDKCTEIDPARRYQTVSQLEWAFKLRSGRKAGVAFVFAAAVCCFCVLPLLRGGQPQPAQEALAPQAEAPPIDERRFDEAFIALPAAQHWRYPEDGTAFAYRVNEMKFNPSFTLAPYGDTDDAFLLTSPSKVRDVTFSGKDAAYFSYMERSKQQADGTWETRLLFFKHLPTTDDGTYNADATVMFEDGASMLVNCRVDVKSDFVVAGDNPPRDFYVGKATKVSVLIQSDDPDTQKYIYTWRIVDGQNNAGFSPDADSPENIEVTHEAKEGKHDSIFIYGHQPGTFTVECMVSGLVNGKLLQCGYLLPNVTVHEN